MDVSVVVPTLNDRDILEGCLESLAQEKPTEIIVVNGPSTDGTSGMIRKRSDVTKLVEIDDRNVNVARNAGLDRVRSDIVAFVNPEARVESGWKRAIRTSLTTGDVVTGPIHHPVRAGVTTESVETTRIRDRTVTYFNSGNMASQMDVMTTIDGFDEYLEIGGARDAAHAMAANEYSVTWTPEMAVTIKSLPDGGQQARNWQWRYQSLAYRLAKYYGFHPTVLHRIGRHSISDALDGLSEVIHGETQLSNWFGTGRDVVFGTIRGTFDGYRTRYILRSKHHRTGWSDRTDRAVSVYDQTES